MARSNLCKAALLGLLWLCLSAASGAARSEVEESGPAHEAEAILVQGRRVLPRVWFATKPGHEMWIIGTLAIAPKSAAWATPELEALVQTVEGVFPDFSQPVASFSGAAPKPLRVALDGGRLARAARDLNRSTDNAGLAAHVSAEDYATYQVFRATGARNNAAVDEWDNLRANHAAERLRTELVLKTGHTFDGGSFPGAISALLGKWKKPIVGVGERNAVAGKEAAQMLRSFERDAKAALAADTSAQERQCFHANMQGLPAYLDAITRRSEAWARGDLKLLRALPEPVFEGCDALIPPTTRTQAKTAYETWRRDFVVVAERHRSLILLAPVEELFKPDGVLQDLRARGFQIQAPE